MYGGDAAGRPSSSGSLRSYMCVPMHGHDQVLGAVTFATGDPAAASTRPTSRSRRSSRGGRRLRSRTRCSTARPRSAGGRHGCSPPSPTECSSSTPRARSASGIRPPRRSRACWPRTSLGRPAAEAFPAGRRSSPRDRRTLRVPARSRGPRPCRSSWRARALALDLGRRFRRWHGLRLPRLDPGAGARGAEGQLRLDRLPRAADAAGRDLRRGDDAAAPRYRGDDRRRNQLLDVIASEAERLAAIVNDILLGEPARLGRGARCNRELRRRGLARASRRRQACTARTGSRFTPCAARASTRRRRSGQDPAGARQPGRQRDQVLPGRRPRRDRAAPRPASVAFAVHDEGLGIPPAEQPRIFEKFYRLDPNMTRGVGGTGLGLYICRELVHRMHGGSGCLAARRRRGLDVRVRAAHAGLSPSSADVASRGPVGLRTDPPAGCLVRLGPRPRMCAAG